MGSVWRHMHKLLLKYNCVRESWRRGPRGFVFIPTKPFAVFRCVNLCVSVFSRSCDPRSDYI